MIEIKKSAYNVLIRKYTIHEDCGILAGKDKYFSKIYPAKNSSKKKNDFEIGFIEKMKILFKMIKEGFYDCILFHVHNTGLMMSVNDVKNSKVGSLNMVVCKRKVGLFKVIKTRNGKNCIPVEYKLV